MEKKKSQISFLANYAILLTFIFDPTYSGPTGFSLKMIMRDSPESPLYPGNLTDLQSLERLVGYAQARLKYLEFSTSFNSTVMDPQDDTRMSLFRQEFLYFVKFALGNPSKWVYLIMDSGGSLVWTQCLPCRRCYQQSVPIYDSKASLTFSMLPCNHPLCTGPGAPFRCVDNSCVYNAIYGTGERTEGVAAMDAIRFRRGGDSFQNFVFGCSKSSTGFEFANTAIGGIMGLSFAPHSIVSLLDPVVHRRFSYCLVPIGLRVSGSSALTFGDAIPAPKGVNVLATPFVPSPNLSKHLFYLNLIDISVGWERLRFPPGTFGFSSGGVGGFFIDSGTSFTILAQTGVNPYEKVIDAFKRYYDGKGLKSTTISGELEVCYEYPDGFDMFESMTYHFQGADYVVDGKFVGFFGEDKYFCAAVLPGNTKSILGAVHQQNTRFIYDGNVGSLQFYREKCS